MAKKTVKSDKVGDKHKEPPYFPKKEEYKTKYKKDKEEPKVLPFVTRLTLFNLGPDFDHAALREDLLTQIDVIEICEFEPEKTAGNKLSGDRNWGIHIRIDQNDDSVLHLRSRNFRTCRGAYEAYERFLNAIKPLGVVFTGSPFELPPDDPRPHANEATDTWPPAPDKEEIGPYAPTLATTLGDEDGGDGGGGGGDGGGEDPAEEGGDGGGPASTR